MDGACAALLLIFSSLLPKSCPPHAFSLAPSLIFSPRGVFPQDFKWSLIQEAIAAAEGIDFSEVPSFLLRENPVVWT